MLRALNFTTTMTSRVRTKSVIAVITQSRKSWNQMMSSITGVAPFCMPSCHGCGWPLVAATAAPTPSTVRLVIMNATNRLSTSIVQCAPSTRNRPCSGPFAAHHGYDVRRGPLSTAFATGVAAWAVRRDGGKSRPLKPQFQPSRNAPHDLVHATIGVSKRSFWTAFTGTTPAL